MLFKHWGKTQGNVHWRQAPLTELHHQCMKLVILCFYFVSEPIPSLDKTKRMDSAPQFLHQWKWGGGALTCASTKFLLNADSVS